MSDEHHGTVKWFDPDLGYGFIEPDGGGDDIFVHFSALQVTGYKTVDDGARVRFSIVQGDRGPQAADVHIVEGAPGTPIGDMSSERLS